MQLGFMMHFSTALTFTLSIIHLSCMDNKKAQVTALILRNSGVLITDAQTLPVREIADVYFSLHEHICVKYIYTYTHCLLIDFIK